MRYLTMVHCDTSSKHRYTTHTRTCGSTPNADAHLRARAGPRSPLSQRAER